VLRSKLVCEPSSSLTFSSSGLPTTVLYQLLVEAIFLAFSFASLAAMLLSLP
jgi:hypothetical protein